MSGLGKILLCGCDDSNHKGQEGHEIILATFSFFQGDGEYKHFRNRKRCWKRECGEIYDNARRWMKDTIRDYRFAAIERERAVMDSNIPWVLPTLIKGYLETCPHDVSNLRVFIDGRLGGPDRESIVEEFPGFPDMGVRSIIKRNPGKKSAPRTLYCPKVLWAADIWANMVYRAGVKSNLDNPRRIIIP